MVKITIIFSSQLLLSSYLFGYTLTDHSSNDGIHYTFTGYCSNGNGTFQGNHTPDIQSAYACGPNGCISGKSKDEVIYKTCNKKQTRSSYGYIKKGALVFRKRTGGGSIEHALTPEKDFNRMDSATRDAIFGDGEYDVFKIRSKSKIKIIKKYHHNISGSNYYKIADSSSIYYILEKDLLR